MRISLSKIETVSTFDHRYCNCASRFQILVFGLNDRGQLGLGTKEFVLIPTVSKFFKDDQYYIIGCSTSDSCSLIIMNNVRFLFL